MEFLKALSKSRRVLFTEALDLLAAKLAEDEAAIGVEFPYVTEPDGAWRTMPASLSAGYSGEAWSQGRLAGEAEPHFAFRPTTSQVAAP